MKEVLEPGIPQPRKKKWVIGGVCLTLLIALAIAAKPTWSLIKEWRAVQLSEEAMEFLKQDSLEIAWEKAQSAYALYPQNEQVARTVATVTMRADPAIATGFWESTYKLSNKHEDLVKLISAAILSRQFPLAEEYFNILKKEAPDAGDTYLMEARLDFAERKLEDATIAAEKAIQATPPPEESHFLYVQLTQFSDNPEVRQTGIDYLRKLSERNDLLGLRSLRNLGNYSLNSPEDLKDVIERLKKHPLAEQEDQLLALRLRMMLPDAQAAQNLIDARAILNEDDPNDLVELGRWLNQQGRYAQTLEVISPEKAKTRADLFLIWIDALAVLDQWDTIDKVLKDGSTPIDNYLRLLFQARVYMETGQSERADFAWSRAILGVANDPTKLWYLTRYTSRLGLYDETREALGRLTGIPSARRQAFEQSVALEQRHGSVTNLRDSLNTMHEAYPKDLSVLNDLAYANLLLNENIDESMKQVQLILEEGSPYLANRMTLALGLYRMGHYPEAAAVLDPLDVDWDQARSGWRAVYAAILRANGREARADQIIATISQDDLLEEERDLLGRNNS